MNESKSWYESKTVWGGLIALIAGVAGIFGIDIGIEDQATIVNSLIAVGSAVGGLLAVYGRFTADKNIK
jgi:hypothetical protein